MSQRKYNREILFRGTTVDDFQKPVTVLVWRDLPIASGDYALHPGPPTTMDPKAIAQIPVYKAEIPGYIKEEDVGDLHGDLVPLAHIYPLWRNNKITKASTPLLQDSYMKVNWVSCLNRDHLLQKWGSDADKQSALFERHNREIDVLEMFRKGVTEGLDVAARPNIVEYRGCVPIRDPANGAVLVVGPILRKYRCTLDVRVEGKLLEHACPSFDPNAIVSDIKSGLDHIHNLGLVHDDIKPDNIMLDDAGRAITIDFDSCQPIGSESVGGTPGWSTNPKVALPENDFFGLDLITKFLKGEYDGNDFSAHFEDD